MSTQQLAEPSLIHQIEDVLRDTQTLNGLTIEGLNYKVTAFTRAPLLLEQALAEIKVLEQRNADSLDALNRMTDQRDEALGGQPAIELPQHRLRTAIQEAAEYNEMIPLHTDDPDALAHQKMVRHWLSGKGMHPQQINRIGELVAQLKDATAQCGAQADLLRSARKHYDTALENGDFTESSDIEYLVNQIDEIDAILAGKLPPVPVPQYQLEPAHGDVLPALGETVHFNMASSDSWEPYTVAGFYAWQDLKFDSSLHLVFVRGISATGTANSRLLKDVRRGMSSEQPGGAA